MDGIKIEVIPARNGFIVVVEDDNLMQQETTICTTKEEAFKVMESSLSTLKYNNSTIR